MVALDLKPGQTRETADPVVQVMLPAGTYELTLVAIGADQKQSKPVKLSLTVKKQP
jgi:hypothetical protein